MENERIEVSIVEYRELLEQATRLGILRRMINDKDNEYRGKPYDGDISTKVLRQVLGMAPCEADNV